MPGVMGLILMLICAMMTSITIVSEKEAGTIEQINVTPVGKFTFIAAKLIPYWPVSYTHLDNKVFLLFVFFYEMSYY